MGTGLPCCDWRLLQRLGCRHQAALLQCPLTAASRRLPGCSRIRCHKRLFVRATGTGTEALSQGGTQKIRRDLKLDNLEAAWKARQQSSAGNNAKASTSGRPPAGSGPKRGGRGAGSSAARGGGRAGAQGGASAAPVRGRRRPGKAPVTTERLAKVIARAGIASRRAAEELVTAGRVKVNGEKVLLPQHQVRASSDKVVVDGKELPRTTELYYFALNKPKGYLCANAASKEGTAKLIGDLFQEWRERVWRRKHPDARAVPPRLFTVGRLDVASTGLIFVTNDGAWAQAVQHPSAGITKEYVVATDRDPTRRELEAIAAGCEVEGTFCAPVAVAPVREAGQRPRVRVVVAEGRKHEVRLLVAHAGLQVEALKRVRIGGYRLPRELGIGQHVPLRPHELRRIVDRGAQDNNAAINPYFSFGQ